MTEMNTLLKTTVDNIKTIAPKTANLFLRFALNFILMLFFPTFIFIIYMGHYHIFSYDFFSFGSFGLKVFFYIAVGFIAYFTLLFVLPFYFIREIRKNWKKLYGWFMLILLVVLNIIFIFIFMESGLTLLLIGLLLPGLTMVVLTVYALKAPSIKKYLGALMIGAFILIILPMIGPQITVKIVGLSLKLYGVGGELPIKICSLSKELSYDGKLILLSPNAIFMKDVNDDTLIMDRRSDVIITLGEQNKSSLDSKRDKTDHLNVSDMADSQKDRRNIMEWKDIGVVLAFALGILNLLYNYRISRKTAFINTVTTERIKWIEQLRQDISTFSGLTYTWCFSDIEGKPEENEFLQKIDKLRHVIRLRLNPEGEYDKKLEELIRKIPDLTAITKREELKQALEELTVTTQKLLKEEWEKVKQEAKRGDLTQ